MSYLLRAMCYVLRETMFETINEAIEVIACFQGTTVRPLRFKWRGQLYDNLTVNLVHRSGSGDDKRYYFNVSDSVNSFRLCLATADLSWSLETLYYDG